MSFSYIDISPHSNLNDFINNHVHNIRMFTSLDRIICCYNSVLQGYSTCDSYIIHTVNISFTLLIIMSFTQWWNIYRDNYRIVIK